MLHIILGILKLIGILLAVLLLLVLLTVLAVLLVPVRYRIRIARTDSEMGAQARVTWLLHMISVLISYDISKKEQQLVIRIFGIPLDSIFGAVKKLTTRKGRKTVSEEYEIPEEDDTLEEDDAPEEYGVSEEDSLDLEVEDDEYEPGEQPALAGDSLVKTADHPAESSEHEVMEPAADEIEDIQEAKTEEADQMESEEAPETNQEEPKEPFCQKLFCKLRSVCDKIKGIPEKIRNIINKMLALIRRVVWGIKGACTSAERLYEKLAQMPDQIAAFQAMLETYEVKAAAGDVIEELMYILLHYGPRKAEGYLHFGTGDPATTGQLTGFLYMILPTRAGMVEIQPEFTEAIFHADLIIKGYVRAVHVIPVGWRLLRSKRLKRLMKKIRKLRS